MEAMTIEEAVNWYLTEKGREEGLEKGLEKGREKGREEGKEETTIANARNAIALGLDNETIAQITSLSVEAVERLRSNG